MLLNSLDSSILLNYCAQFLKFAEFSVILVSSGAITDSICLYLSQEGVKFCFNASFLALGNVSVTNLRTSSSEASFIDTSGCSFFHN
jgi:hypothetical protein